MRKLLILFLGINILISRIGDFSNSILPFLVLTFFSYLMYIFISDKSLREKKLPLFIITLTAVTIWVLYFIKVSNFSNDIYRYFWDGKLVASAVNPYIYTPHDPALKEFQNSNLYKLVDWKDLRTPYPPLAQIIFWFAYNFYNLLGFFVGKLVFILPVILTSYLIFKLVDKKFYPIFVLNPLLTLEIFYSGHLDGYIVLFLFLAIYFYAKDIFNLSSLFLALSILTKIYPIFFLPILVMDLIRKRKVGNSIKYLAIFFSVSVVFYLPFIRDSLLPITNYLELPQEQEFNAGIYRYLYQIIGLVTSNSHILAQKISFLLFFVTYLFLLTKKYSLNLLILIGIVYLFFSPIVFPWYTLFFIPIVLLETKNSGNKKILLSLFLMEFLLTVTYLEPKQKIRREIILNIEYLTLVVLLFYFRSRSLLSHRKAK